MFCAGGGGLCPSPPAGSPARKPAAPGLRSGFGDARVGGSTAVRVAPISTIPGRSEREAFEPAARARGDGRSPPPRAQNETLAYTSKSSAAWPPSAPAKRDPSSAESAKHFSPG